MKPLNILFFSLLYFLVYLATSLGIDIYFGLETSIPELIAIGFVFDILLIILLVFDVPEKIINKILDKDENVVEIPEETEDSEEIDNLEETPQEEKVEEVIPPQIIEQTPEKVEELY